MDLVKNKKLLRLLEWDEFQGEPDKESPYKAHIYWKINYNFNIYNNNNKIKCNCQTFCEVEKRSWVQKCKIEGPEDQKLLLNHEQGHYNIGVLCALQFKKKVMQKNFSNINNVRQEIYQLFIQTLQNYQEIEKQYDIQTDHKRNQKMQNEWDRKIRNKLLKMQHFDNNTTFIV